MKWMQIPLGPLQTNCYILKNDQSCLIVDPGDEAERIFEILTQQDLIPQAILLTHAHFDHIGAVDAVRDRYGIEVYIHEKEAKWLFDPALNGSQFFMMNQLVRIKPANQFFYQEGTYNIGDFQFQLFETPGHSPGSVSFYFAEEQVVISGDALFRYSIGRTDLPGGNHQQLLTSIKENLLSLPENTLVLPGHGEATTIGDEMEHNPFLHGF